MVENNRKINLCGIGSNSNDEKKLTFEEENEQYAGEEITLNFRFPNQEEQYQETFKAGQDFQYVKYRLSSVIEVDPEFIELTFNKKVLIDFLSICDANVKNNDIIDVDVKEG